MIRRFEPQRAVVAPSLALILAGIASCQCAVALVGPPQARFDHNRTRQVVSAAIRGGVAGPVDQELYARADCCGVPSIRNEPPEAALDSAPSARLFPIFTGVPLPLSDAAVTGGRSDRADLLDYLAAGPQAGVGVDPGFTSGDPVAAEAAHAPVLRLLADGAALAGGIEVVEQQARAVGLATTRRVVDSRYPLASYDAWLAVGSGDFWFVLFDLIEGPGFSRLVVVPARPIGQDFEGKLP